MVRSRLCVAAVVALSLTACQTSDRTQTLVEAGAIGVAIGGGIGLLAGGGDGAAIGAAVGLGLGVLIGSLVADEKQAYVDTEEMIKAETTLARQRHAALKDYNGRLKAEIARLDKEIRKQKRDAAQGRVILASQRDLSAKTEREHQAAQQQVEQLGKKLAESKALLAKAQAEKGRNAAELSAWQGEMRQLDKQEAELKKLLQAYSARVRSVGSRG
ncbi:uncharacterized protein YcfJ [Azospirillum agricola]|uniref:hypothetical protein n=1 Tax=Azospirillum agricola TaxID=1720247 RepID=UPI001AE9AC8A|nr:hypothetical protein [Azospirillum agricola]MBP2227667.1 uncharacterized protein YcfJ [Azospirillum agricola]